MVTATPATPAHDAIHDDATDFDTTTVVTDMTPEQHHEHPDGAGPYYAVPGLCNGDSVFALDTGATLYCPFGREAAFHDGAQLPGRGQFGFEASTAFELTRMLAAVLNAAVAAGESVTDDGDGLSCDIWNAFALHALGFQI